VSFSFFQEGAFMNRATTAYSFPIILAVFSFAVLFNSTAALGQNESKNSVEARDLNQQAIKLIDENKYTEAISRLEKAIQLDPSYGALHMNLGTAYLLSEQPETALTHVKRGVELQPDRPEGYNQLGVVYDKMEKYDLAIDNLKKAIELKPDYTLGYLNLGSAYLYANRLKPAQTSLEKAAKLDPSNTEVHITLGVVYAKQSRFDQAIAEAKQATKLRPNDDRANLTLCKIYLLADDRKSAIEMYQSVKSVNIPLAEKMFQSIFSGKVLYVGKK
jgi:Flp pilus assembly protein TadD